MRVLCLFLILMGCAMDETVAKFLPKDTPFALTMVNGTSVDYRANIMFSDEGRVSGAAPCNRYFSKNSAPYPWIDLDVIGSTKMACPALKEEAAFFDALRSMTLVEVSGPILLLSNDKDETMEFRQDVTPG